MNFSKLLYSFFHTLISIFFIFLGIICTLIPWFPAVRTHIILFLIENTAALSLFGLILILVGSGMLANILLTVKHRYYRITGGEKAISVDEALIQQFLDKYWKTLFPNCDVPNKVMLKKNRIHLSANFPNLPLSEQKKILERIEGDLTEAFEHMFEYRKEFYLSVSFREST